jgi:hypothetical protein
MFHRYVGLWARWFFGFVIGFGPLLRSNVHEPMAVPWVIWIRFYCILPSLAFGVVPWVIWLAVVFWFYR